LAGRIEFNFSHVFDGTVWNIVAVKGRELLLVEVRNSQQKKVSFSAVSGATGVFLWRDMFFDETWWVTLAAASEEIALFTVYHDKESPERKGVLAYHILDQKIAWWNNDFSLHAVAGMQVLGETQKYGKTDMALDLFTGERAEKASDGGLMEEVGRPEQYLDNNAYFSTVKTFLSRQFNLVPVIALEYLEHDSNIVVSFYAQEAGLANYLLIISAEGELLLKEKLGDKLSGIGIDTFFVLSGCLIFVKNKIELHSYRFV
jgi:hypothetical protein